MAAPIGNQFWKLRSKHGRDKIFGSPEILWQAACEYFEWCDKNPIKKEIPIGTRHNPTVEVSIGRPYTLHALCIYLGVNTKYFNDFCDAKHEGFSEILTHIKEIIYNHKYEGAVVGLFNSSIIAKDLGLVEKKDITSDGEKLGFISPETVKEIANKINRNAAG